MKILHTADLHIGAELSYLDRTSDARQYEVLEVFKNITELCQEQSVDICIIAGDLFDSNKAGKPFAKAVFDYIAAACGTLFFCIAGNHDPLDAASPYVTEELPENLKVFGPEYEQVVIEKLGVRICGRSFSHSSMEFSPLPYLADDGLVNILISHSDLGISSGGYNPLPYNVIENSGADYIALGHIHKRTTIEKLGSSFIAYPGCPEGQGFDEEGVKGVYIGELEKGVCKMEFYPTSKRVHTVKKIDLSEAQSTEDAEKIILESLKNDVVGEVSQNLYKLVLSGVNEDPSRIDMPLLHSRLAGKLYFVKIRNEVKQKLDLESISKEVSLRGIFVSKMLDKIAAAGEDDKKPLAQALYLGLEAFDSEVAYNED